MDEEGLECLEGSIQVTNDYECRNQAFSTLKDKGYVRYGVYFGSWADHVPGCFEGYGTWDGGSGNGNVHFNTNGASKGSRGYRICKQNTSKEFLQYKICKV